MKLRIDFVIIFGSAQIISMARQARRFLLQHMYFLIFFILGILQAGQWNKTSRAIRIYNVQKIFFSALSMSGLLRTPWELNWVSSGFKSWIFLGHTLIGQQNVVFFT